MPLNYLQESPSQTAGPYVHIGLIPHQAGFDIFEKNFSNVLVKDGTQGERIQRIERLAAEIAPLVGADVAKTKRAAHLAKADLLTEVVGEFPELQGLMGKYYALAQGEPASVAAASEEHYKPQGPADRVPTDPVSVAVAPVSVALFVFC